MHRSLSFLSQERKSCVTRFASPRRTRINYTPKEHIYLVHLYMWIPWPRIQHACGYSRNRLLSECSLRVPWVCRDTYRVGSWLVSPPRNTGATDTPPKLVGKLYWKVQCSVPQHQGDLFPHLVTSKFLCPSTVSAETYVSSCLVGFLSGDPYIFVILYDWGRCNSRMRAPNSSRRRRFVTFIGLT